MRDRRDGFSRGIGFDRKPEKEIRQILDDELPYIELLESQLIKNCRQLQLAARTLLFSKGQF